MQTITRRRLGFLTHFFVVATAFAPVAPQAKAVILEHKWQAGQQLPYNVMLKGTLSGQTDASWAGPLTNLPIDIKLDGNGRWVLNTLSVDSSGNGTVQIQVPQLFVKGNAWGMGASLKIEDGQATAGLNGAPGKTFDVSGWTNPSTAIVISRNAQVQALTPIAATPDSSTQSDEVTSNVTSKVTSNVTNNATRTMNDLARLMPQLWPGRDIQVGESWTIDAKIPLGNSADVQQLSVGSFVLKLEGEENVDGRTLQRVGVSGAVDISGEKADIINDAARAKNPNAPRVVGSTQNVTGSILFDSMQGQIARAWFKIVSKNEISGMTPAKERKPAQKWMLKHGFNGTLQIQQAS